MKDRYFVGVPENESNFQILADRAIKHKMPKKQEWHNLCFATKKHQKKR
ncbi:MAG: hypothetical protein HWN68_01535 [Desulfobacterales bacterium]|nr:hypothetical protein [Desulfobacterales bacterium]